MPITQKDKIASAPVGPSKTNDKGTSKEVAVEEHYVAKETISAEQFIPHYLDTATARKIVQNAGTVGIRGFNCSDYTDRFNPYLTLSDITVGEPLLFPDHPHFGHEMMLYVLAGEFKHEDFLGCTETFTLGDVHWMTTGRGIIHAQAPGNRIKDNRHVQFWINLPSSHKNIPPNNQVLRANSVPQWTESTGLTIKLLVGQYKGKRSSIKTVTPLLMMDVILAPGATGSIEIPAGHFVGTYTLDGTGKISNQTVTQKSVTRARAHTEASGAVILANTSSNETWRFLLYSGEPIDEKVTANGFFVGCSSEETQKTISSFEKRTDSFAAGQSWSSSICRSNKPK